MCTLTLAWRVFPDTPVVVAANRDESTDRPSSPPAVRSQDGAGDHTRRVLAPRDERAGGTWIGVNDHGVFAGITNRWTDIDLAGDRSRGRLVDDTLASETAVQALERVQERLEALEYDGFNLVLADADDAFLIEWDGEASIRQFDPGVHVVVNVGADDQYDIPERRQSVGEQQRENARRARDELSVADEETAAEWLARAKAVLADHDYGLCIHGDGYGTRSSSLVSIPETGDVEYAFADGPPCETSFQTVEHDL